MKSSVRVRFAPSPTGLIHLGNLRSALFNWLFAKNRQGDFILRFEDTDRARFVPEAANYIKESLTWLGLTCDEGPDTGGKFAPYQQSQRLDIYKQHAEVLLEKGSLYRDWTDPQKLEEMRKTAQKNKTPFKVSRELLQTEGDINKPHVLRFKIDETYDPEWEDAVRGKLSQSGSELDDFVCVKSDGFPTYNFANVVDDHLMEITHVIRGDEFIASTPKFLQVYRAFGWEPPRFAHVPPVLGADKAKLSKRHGALGVLEYRDLGYLPEAIINFLATLGWNDGTTQEIYVSDELVHKFQLERIQKSPAIFDTERLNWLNGVHIRNLAIDELNKRAAKFWPKAAGGIEDEYKKQVLKLVQERLKYLAELPELTDFFFEDPKTYPDQLDKADAKRLLPKVLETIREVEFDEETLEKVLRSLVNELDTDPGTLFKLIRITITGKTTAPGLFETMATLGKDTVTGRLQTVLNKV